ncbi:MAG: dTDP-4-dehydrorhamnose 3,5-epimerase [Brevefilum sp.]|nr:dTDP-4-dehydrorhamnose 3,5-epimerase [Brevefilum sp.]MDW7754637.1 dTDP-4-dehydrorhamnose 3,5-epimerase [Brevefilum sp.]
MEFIPTTIPDVIIIKPKVFTDDRGFFLESYKKQAFINAGITQEFVQDNHSSSQKATLRGLHYQITHAQGKLVKVVIGEIYDVAVDLRKSSPYYGKWVGAYLSAENKHQLWIPPGFGHGFFATTSQADVLYKATDYYDKQGERCILWNDPDLAIDWPIPNGHTPVISEKDASAPKFKEAEVFS